MIVGGGDTNLEISRSLRSGLHYAIIFYSDVFRPDLESTQARLVSLYELVRYLCMCKPLMIRQNREKRGSIKFAWKFVTKHIVVMAVVSRALQSAPPHVLSSFGSFTTNHRLNHQSADFVLYVKLVNKQMNLSKVNQTSESNNNEHIRKRTYPSFSFRFKQLAQQRKG